MAFLTTRCTFRILLCGRAPSTFKRHDRQPRNPQTSICEVIPISDPQKHRRQELPRLSRLSLIPHILGVFRGNKARKNDIQGPWPFRGKHSGCCSKPLRPRWSENVCAHSRLPACLHAHVEHIGMTWRMLSFRYHATNPRLRPWCGKPRFEGMEMPGRSFVSVVDVYGAA
jgi:hypothetical protein